MNDTLPALTSPISSRTLLALTEAMEHAFDASAWATLGLELDMPQLGHPESRLQESLRLRDDDYGFFVAQFLRHLQGERPDALRDIAHRPGVKAWLESNAPDAARELGLGQPQVPPPRAPVSASEALDQALKDADHPPGASGAAGHVDHVHTALRGYLRDVCAREGLHVAEDATVAQLFESLRNGHPQLVALDRQGSQAGRALSSLVGAVTAFDTSRDNASVATPDQALPEEAETRLMVNLTRALFEYLRARHA